MARVQMQSRSKGSTGARVRELLANFRRTDRASNTYEAKRQLYKRLLLLTHPDKGGDTASFREVQVTWDRLQRLHTAAGAAYNTAVNMNWEPTPPPATVPQYRVGLTAQKYRRTSTGKVAKPAFKPAANPYGRRTALRPRAYDASADAYVYKAFAVRPRRR